MADNLVNLLGTTTDITVPANSQIAIWSLGAFDVFQVSQGVNTPPVPSLLVSRVANADQYTSGVFSSSLSTVVRIQAQGGAEVWYSVGTNPVVRSGGRMAQPYQAINPSSFSAINTTGTATITQLMSGYITSTTAAAVNITTPNGSAIDAATTMAVGDSFDVVLINTGGTNALALVVGGSSGVTFLGAISTTAGGMTARYVKTAAGAFTVFRV